MLGTRVNRHGATVWMVNTGWTGGPYGVGSRMELGYTRAMVRAALSGQLAGTEFVADPIFGFAVPAEVPGVPSEVLQPRATWADVDAYDAQAQALAAMFRDNFNQYADHVSDDIRNAGPRV